MRFKFTRVAVNIAVQRESNKTMIDELGNLAQAGRRALAQQDWATVDFCARGILSRQAAHPEGLFLRGLVEKAARRPRKAIEAFEEALDVDAARYDVAIELASLYSMSRRNGEAAALIDKYSEALTNSPKYLDMAGTTYTEIGLPDRAWPLYQRACELQPEAAILQGNMASCAVYVGEIEIAEKAYRKLLESNPNHQRNHYALSRLKRAKDKSHIKEMERVLQDTRLPPERNVFIHYALGKEYEDLGIWDKSFQHYKAGGDAVTKVANYDIQSDIAIIDKVIDRCNEAWVHDSHEEVVGDPHPLFVVGLPRTGTTLVERILSSHSSVSSVGETEFVQMMLRQESGIESVEKMTPEMIEAVVKKDIAVVRDGYMDQIRYRLGDESIFIDKLPFNVLYLGFIAKAWPDKPVILMKRNPMDACFSMYKQVFTWAYKYSYSLDTLAAYYVAYDRLCRHWRSVLGDRLVEVQYEVLVAEQESETRRILERLELPFEEACLNFESNKTPTTTASSVQVREKAHTRSVDKWREFEEWLAPLREKLESAGIEIG